MAKKAIDDLVSIHAPAFVTIVMVVIYVLLNRSRENIEDYDDMDDTLSENEMQPQHPPHGTSNIPSPRRSPTPETSSDPIMAELINGFAKIASAIKEARKSWKENLFEVIWVMEDYDYNDRVMALDALGRDEIKGRAFTHKKPSMRKSGWTNSLPLKNELIVDFTSSVVLCAFVSSLRLSNHATLQPFLYRKLLVFIYFSCFICFGVITVVGLSSLSVNTFVLCLALFARTCVKW